MEPTLPEEFNKNASGAGDTPADKPAATEAPADFKQDALLTLAKESKYDEARAALAMGANVNVLNDKQESPLVLAIGNYDVRMTRLFLHAGADVARYEETTGNSLLCALRHAGTNYKPEEETIACMLLDHGAAPDARDNHGMPLVARYASLGMAEAVERILQAGANPNATNVNNTLSALYFAISNDARSLPAVKALLDGGADPNGAPQEGTLPIFLAVRQKNMPAAELLVKAGADVNRINPDNQMTPLLLALKNGQDDMVNLLVSAGADINRVMPDGTRALDVLVRDNADITIIQKALALGARADICRSDADGAPVDTPLHAAVRHKRLDMINDMLKAGADPLVVDGFGYTPLQLAHSLYGSEEAVVDRLRLADGAARIERENAYRAAAVMTPPTPPKPPAP